MLINPNPTKITNTWLIIIGFLLIAGSGYWYYVDDIKPQLRCETETFRCPDGSYVSRTWPICEFSACPKIRAERTSGGTFEPGRYRNDIYGFSLKFSENWNTKDYLPSNPQVKASLLIFLGFNYGKDVHATLQVKKSTLADEIGYIKNGAYIDYVVSSSDLKINGMPGKKIIAKSIAGEALEAYAMLQHGDEVFIFTNDGDAPAFWTFVNSLMFNLQDTSTWKTYRNEKYGFEVKYPLESDTNNDPMGKSFVLFSHTAGRFEIDISRLDSRETWPTYEAIDINFSDCSRTGDGASLVKIMVGVGGYEACKTIGFRGSVGRKVYLQQGEYIFLIAYEWNEPLSQEYDFEQILSTFEFLK